MKLFCNMKLVLQHREENIRFFLLRRTTTINFSDFSKIHRKNLKKLVAIHFHPSHPLPNIINTSFCVLVALLLTTLNHHLNDFIEINTSFGPFKVTLKLGTHSGSRVGLSTPFVEHSTIDKKQLSH